MKELQILMNPLLMLGTFFCIVASLGVLRLPDVFLRIHAASKASTLGVIFLSIATAIRFADTSPVVAKCFLIVVFLFLTAPVSAHLIGRAARKRQNPMSDRLRTDEYDL